MNDLQIDYFLAVATNLSFTKTSAELYVSQPAISKQIALMEKELGVKLFFRNNKKTTLTEAGEMYFEYFKKYKLEMRNLQQRALSLQNKNIHNIRVGFLEGWDLKDIIPKLMERFKDKYPNSTISFDCCGVKDLTSLLITGGIDLALTFKTSLADFDDFQIDDVVELKKCIIVSNNHHLAKKENLTIRDFKGEKFFAPWGVAEKMVSEIIYSYLRPYGYTPEIEFVHNNESMITCVRNNLGVAFSDTWAFIIEADDVTAIDIDLTDTVSIATVKNNTSEHVKDVAAMLKDIVENL